MSKICIIENCDNSVNHPTMGLCKTCYSSMYYWSRKSLKQMLQRAVNLSKYECRLNSMLPSAKIVDHPMPVTLLVKPGSKKRFKKKPKNNIAIKNVVNF